jgi:glycosyltransferase involved in cell wall biosynthesis
MTVLALYSWPAFWSMGEGSGAPSFFLSVTAFPKHGHEMHVLMPGGRDRPAEEDYHGVRLHRFRTNVDFNPDVGPSKLIQHLKIFLSYLYWYLRVVPAGIALARRLRPDVVFGMGAVATPTARIVARAVGVPNVTRLFGQGLGQVVGDRFRYSLRYPEIKAFRTPTSYLILHNDGSGGDGIARSQGVPDEKLRFWPNGNDRSAYSADRGAVRSSATALAAELGVPEGHRVVLNVARLHPEKGLDRLIAAAPDVLAERQDVVFVVVGEGPLRDDLVASTVSHGVADRFLFAGSLPRERMPLVYALADVFVTVSDRTNMGNPLDEAMMSGLPVVALNTGKTADVVKNEETGVLLEMADLPNLGRVLLDLLQDDERRARLGAAAHRNADERLPTVEERQAMEVGIVEQAVAEFLARRGN